MRLLPILLAALALAPGAAASADTPAQAKQAIQARYDQEIVAAKKKDAAALFADETPDYVSIDVHGKRTTRAQEQAEMGQMLPMVSSVSGHTTIDKIVLRGNTAILTIHDRGSLTLKAPNRPAMRLTIETHAQDTWVKTAKGWMKKQSKEISSKHTINGKPA